MSTTTATPGVQGAGSERSNASFARAAMLHLAERRLAPTPENYTEAWVAVGGPHTPVDPVVQEHDRQSRRVRRAERLVAELTEMVKTLCDTVDTLAEDERWVRGQIDALREMLAGEIDHVSVAELRALLSRTSDMQRRIAEQRRRALAHLKSTLVELATVLSGLLKSTDQFGRRITEHATEIQGASSIASLSDTVQRLLDDTRTMQADVSQSHEGLKRGQDAAHALEREVSRLEEQLAAASAEIVTDHLTQTMNRRGLEDCFTGAQARARQSRQSLALALVDVDDFKKLNDALGHAAGDDALRHLANVLKERLRPTDAVARYGGEEFVILLPGANLSDAQDTLVRLQREMTRHVFLFDAHRRFITFSAGVTPVRPEDSLLSAVARADDAMYRAKREGKNCVRVG
jgi:diguanylate cyclase